MVLPWWYCRKCATQLDKAAMHTLKREALGSTDVAFIHDVNVHAWALFRKEHISVVLAAVLCLIGNVLYHL